MSWIDAVFMRDLSVSVYCNQYFIQHFFNRSLQPLKQLKKISLKKGLFAQTIGRVFQPARISDFFLFTMQRFCFSDEKKNY
jgi:hypothetical protein